MWIFSKMRWIAAFRIPRKVRLFFYTHTLLADRERTDTNNGLLISANNQIGKFGMTFEVGLHKWAIDFYGQMMGTCIMESVFRQNRSDTTTAQFLRNFRMHEE